MRILTVVQDLGPGGTQRVAETCAIGYRSLGVDSAVLAYGGSGPRAARLKASGIPLFVGGCDGASRGSAVRLSGEWAPNVVHIHRTGYSESVSGEILSSLASPKRRIMETNVFARFDSSSAGSLIDVHILLSSWCLWKYERWARGAPPQPVVVVPNPVETEHFYPSSEAERAQIREEWGVRREEVVFGRVGQPISGKWSPVIFWAFERIARADPRIHLVLAGMPESLMSHVARLSKNVRDRVHMLPFQFGDAALQRVYGGFDVFLHAAEIGESFGMVLCEAMLCGLPVITLATPLKDNSQTEVVRHGVTGLVCYGKKRLADAMALLASDSPLRRTMGDRGRVSVETRFSSNVVVRRLLEIAELMRRTPGHVELKRELESLDVPPTRLDRRDLDERYGVGLGRLRWSTRIARELVHIPQVYRLWVRMKQASR